MDTFTTSDEGALGSTESPLNSSLVKKDEAINFDVEATDESGISSNGDNSSDYPEEQPAWDIEYRFCDDNENWVVELSPSETNNAQGGIEFEYLIETFKLSSVFYNGSSAFAMEESEECEDENKENIEPL